MRPGIRLNPLQFGWKPLLAALLILALGLCVTAYSLHASYQHANQQAQTEFKDYVDRIEAALQTQFRLPLYGIRGAIAARASMGEMRRSNFRAYVAARDLSQEFPGVRGFGYVEHVMRQDLARFEAQQQADLAPDFKVRSAGTSPDLYVVKFVEPDSGNSAALGLDLGTEPIRREAVLRAVDSGEPSLSGSITLVQNDGKGLGFLYLIPVYQSGKTPDTVQARREQLVGLFYAPLLAQELLHHVADVAHQDVDFELFDGTRSTAQSMVFSSLVDLNALPNTASPTDFKAQRAFHAVRELTIGGRLLRLHAGSSAVFNTDMDHKTPLLIGLGGASLSLMLAFVVWLMIVGRARAEALAHAMTADLDRMVSTSQAAQQALLVEREHLNNIIMGTRAGIWQTNIQTGEMIINERWADMLGYAIQELSPVTMQTWSDLCHPDDLAIARQRLAQHLDGALGFYDTQFRMRHRDGHWVWVQSRGKLSSWSADGRPLWMSGTHLDISEQQYAEEELRRNNAMMQGILDNIPVGLSAFDGELRLIAKNQHFQTNLDLPDTLFQNSVTTFQEIIRFNAQRGEYGQGDHEQAIETIIERARHPQAHLFERVRPNGVVLEVRGAPLPDGGFVTTYTDISERKRAEAEIARTTAMLQSVLDAASEVAVITTDMQRKITLFNTGAERMLGYTAAEVVDLQTPDLFLDAAQIEERRQALSDRLGRPATRGEVMVDQTTLGKKTQWTFVRKDGSRLEVSLVITALFDAQGQRTGYLGISYDISTEKAYEGWLRGAMEEAEAATLAKSQFLANMSHEIRTPMNAILGMLRLLQGTELSERQLDYVSKTEGAAKSLLSLLNDILDFSKMDAGKMSLDPQPFRIDQLMRELSVILSANVGNKPVEVLFDIDPQIPKALVGDAMRLQQVLINLGGNAIKFTEHGEVLIEIRLLAQDADQVSLRFSVRDSGIGIAPQNQQHIFDGFSQAEASTTRRFGGTGLGLPISKQLVTLMGGELSLQSTLGQGSNFGFCISLGRASLSGEDQPPTPLLSELQEPLDVLVIDDNALARSVVASMARSWGWRVQAVGSGQEALDLVQARIQAGQALYQAVFVDWHMPDMDGWQTTQQLQQMMDPAHWPVFIMITAQGREMLSQRSAQEQASLHSFLVKPVTASMLFDAVANARAGRSNLRARPRQKAQGRLRLQGLRLLVVEDNIVNQQVAQELLSAEGAQIELAANGELGVAAVAAAQPPFDAVLMDIQMPVMDGYSATRAIRQELGLTELPVIAMTANAMASDRQACLDAGMNDHVGKPFDLPHLIKVLLQHVRRSGSDSPASEPASPAAPRSERTGSELPEEDALDVPGALERLGGNTPLYARILQSYLQEIALMPEQLKALLLAHDLAAATRLMHTLKGLSATVGASYLAALAKAAEGALKAQPALSQEAIESMWQGLRQGVASTTQRLSALALELTEPSAAHAAVPGEPELSALLPQLQQLRDLLANSDMGALALHEHLQPPLQQLKPELITALQNAISTLDFKLAVSQCDKVLRSLQA